ncbi:MAG: DUF2474 domain-containing protein [Gammaproteobacteria bacterium]
MPDISTKAAGRDAPATSSIWRRFGWFALLWGGSLGVWLLIAYGLRSLLLPA